jgi:hypothetical protein
MSRSLTAEETAALPPMPLGLPVDLPLTLREVVWASAYGAAFAEQFQMAWEAADPGPNRVYNANAHVDVARCKAVADAAVERMTER